jgi:peptide/nickel transport system permease protein
MNKHTDTPTAAGMGIARSVWHRLRRNRFGMGGMVVIAVLFVLSYLAPVIANDKPLMMRVEGKTYFPAVAELVPLNLLLRYPELRTFDYERLQNDSSIPRWQTVVPYSPMQSSLADKLQRPSAEHWMGTDTLGRDVFARVLYGSRVSLKVGLVAMSIALVIGLLMGGLAGFYGGAVDIVVSRIIEIVMCFPFFFLILAVIAFLPPSIFSIMVVIGITRWTGIARYARGEFLRVKQQDYAAAARALGASDRKIIFRHILPNSLAPILVSASFGVASAILIEAALSFLGLGAQPPTPSWGGILANAREFLDVAWWLALFPGLAIFVTVTAYNIFGEGLRDAIDPRLDQGHSVTDR